MNVISIWMKERLWLLMLLLSVNFLTAQKSFTPEEAMSYAIEHHLKMQNAELDIRSSEKKIRETLGIGLPHLSTTGQFQNFLKIPTTVIPARAFDPRAPEDALAELKFGTKYKANGGATLSQLIFNGSYLVGLQATKAFANNSRIMKDKTIQDIRHDVSMAYYTVLMIRSNMRMIKEQKALTEKLLKDIRILIGEGMVEPTGDKQLELTLLNLDDALIAMEGQEKTALVLLKFNMGYPLDDPIALSAELLDKARQIRTLVPMAHPSFEHNPDMRLLANQSLIQSLSIKNAKTAYLPVLTGIVNYSTSAQRNDFDLFDRDGKWFPTALWGLNLSIPIYSGGMTRAKIAQAKIAKMKVENSKQLLEQSFRLRWTKAQTAFEQAIAAYDNKKKSVVIAQELYRTAEIKYKEGMMSSIELDQTTMQLVKAKGDLMMAQYKLVQAQIELDYLLNK